MLAYQKRREEKKNKNRILEDSIFPWDQQVGEPDKAFAVFLRYIAIGKTRNYISVSRTCEIDYATICKYANTYLWKIRADKHDLSQDKEMMIKLDEEIMQSRIRHQRIGEAMGDLAEKGIKMLNENVEELSPQDIVRLIDVGVKIERLSLGSPSEIIKSEVEAKVEMKVEEIDPKIAAEVGKLLAIQKSEQMEINV